MHMQFVMLTFNFIGIMQCHEMEVSLDFLYQFLISFPFACRWLFHPFGWLLQVNCFRQVRHTLNATCSCRYSAIIQLLRCARWSVFGFKNVTLESKRFSIVEKWTSYPFRVHSRFTYSTSLSHFMWCMNISQHTGSYWHIMTIERI
jgi:hypothetical protein